jgi:hypothetical protein
LPPQGELIPWSRILDDEETLCVVNGHGTQARGGDIVVDYSLNTPGAPGNPWGGATPFFRVVANSAQAAAGAAYTGTHPIGSQVSVGVQNGTAFISLQNVAPSEVLVLVNRV